MAVFDVCVECGIDYPPGLVAPFVTMNNAVPRRLCGICALDALNQLHGTKRKQFLGPVAEKSRRAALAFRASRHTPIAKGEH